MKKQLEEKSSYEVVYHAINTTEEGRNWIEEWQEHTSQTVPSICPCCGVVPSGENHFVGAHVRLYIESALSTSEQSMFITPTCNECNLKYQGDSALGHQFLVKKDYLWKVSE